MTTMPLLQLLTVMTLKMLLLDLEHTAVCPGAEDTSQTMKK